MLLIYRNTEVSVHFVYSASEGRKITTCYLHTGRCEEKGCSRKIQPLFGEARCNPRDQFNRSLGREIALGRAFKRAGYTTEIRDALWARYTVALMPNPKVKQ